MLWCLVHPAARSGDEVRVWLTTEDLGQRLTEQKSLRFGDARPGSAPATVLEVDPARTFQIILGLGSSLEPTTCSNLFRLPAAERERVMERLVHPTNGLGMNLMRVCIGTPDFTGDPWHSYCDRPPGETDPDLKHFSIDRDRAYILPALQLARAKNRTLLFFASPWSPPGWMKSTGSLIGGRLLPEWYPAYARYFVRFLQAYEAEGIPIYAITVQNEPGVDRAREKDPKWHYPSCHWTAEQERDFIRDHLGPALKQAGLKTRIWCYDHNYNVTAQGDDPGLPYPRTVLSDPGAARFIQGVAFHGYVGEPSGMSRFHQEFPKVPVHFTEGSVFGIAGARELVHRLRHHAASYNAWVTILDERGRPNNGPFPATHAILKLHSDSLRIEELLEYHVYGHFMKFIRRGALRIASSEGSGDLDNVAFENADGTFAVVVANPGPASRPFVLRYAGRQVETEAPPKSVLTLTWSRR